MELALRENHRLLNLAFGCGWDMKIYWERERQRGLTQSLVRTALALVLEPLDIIYDLRRIPYLNENRSYMEVGFMVRTELALIPMFQNMLGIRKMIAQVIVPVCRLTHLEWLPMALPVRMRNAADYHHVHRSFPASVRYAANYHDYWVCRVYARCTS